MSGGWASCSHIKQLYTKTLKQPKYYLTPWNLLRKFLGKFFLLKIDETLAHPNTPANSIYPIFINMYPILLDIHPVIVDIHPTFIENSCKRGCCCRRRKSWTLRTEQHGWQGDGLNTGQVAGIDGRRQSDKGLQLVQRESSWIWMQKQNCSYPA